MPVRKYFNIIKFKWLVNKSKSKTKKVKRNVKIE